MKYILLLILFISCTDNKGFTGYCVGKELTKSHWSDKSGDVVRYAGVYVPVHVPRKSTPTWVKTSYVVCVANYDNQHWITVDSVTFYRTTLGKKYHFNNF